MGLTDAALAETRQAFDAVAPTYGADNDRNPVIRWMRAHAVRWLVEGLPAGARVLDLGCGPGPDTLALAAQGYAVTALDWSSRMAAQTAATLERQGLSAAARVYAVGIHEPDAWPDGTWRAVLSNLGALNCVPDLPAAARAIASRVPAGGTLVASVIGRTCPWEWALFGCRGQWARVRVRYRSGFVPVPLDGHVVWTQYLTPREFLDAFLPAGFSLVRSRALGVCVPPPYADAFCRRHPRLFRGLQAADNAIAGWPVVRGWGDHSLIQLRRR